MILKRPTAKLKKNHNIALKKTQGFYFEAPGGRKRGEGASTNSPLSSLLLAANIFLKLTYKIFNYYEEI